MDLDSKTDLNSFVNMVNFLFLELNVQHFFFFFCLDVRDLELGVNVDFYIVREHVGTAFLIHFAILESGHVGILSVMQYKLIIVFLLL